MRRVRLGRSNVELSPIGLGCWQFSAGMGMSGGFWPALSEQDTQAIVAASLEAGVNWFDTAELYGKGASEQALARALKACGKNNGDVVVATKWTPALRLAGRAARTIGERERNLAPFAIDLHQVHNPFSLSTLKTQMDVMADLVEAGHIKHVGVSNFSARQMVAAHGLLQRRGLALASNQIRYNLLERQAENNGVLAAAREHGITLIAYSPLAQGVLTGRLHEDPTAVARLPWLRRSIMRARKLIPRSVPVIAALRSVAGEVGCTPAQAALAWVISAHGDTMVAIPGASRAAQAASNAAVMDIMLSEAQKARVDEASRPFLAG